MEEMDIEWPDFLKQQFEIVHAYERLGIDATLSCTPYDRIEGERHRMWAIQRRLFLQHLDFLNNRESGLSALATALTGFAPR